MTITVTKGKLTRWIIMAVILFCGPGQAVDAPKVIAGVVANREFLAGFTGYGDYNLHDVYELRPGLFGVVMLCPVGFKETLVYDTRRGKRELVYRDAVIPAKAKRAELRDESILVSDAVKLACAALEHEKRRNKLLQRNDFVRHIY
jgi:hypothetical protein